MSKFKKVKKNYYLFGFASLLTEIPFFACQVFSVQSTPDIYGERSGPGTLG